MKPLRDNVGIALFNAGGRVLIARRFADDGPEIIQKGYVTRSDKPGLGVEMDESVARKAQIPGTGWFEPSAS